MTARTLDGCIKCGACVKACPVLAQEGSDAFPGPRRLSVEAPRIGGILPSLRSALLMCTTCGRCEEVCPSRLPLPRALVRVRAIASQGAGLTDGQARMLENVAGTGRTVVPEGSPPVIPSSGDLLFFPGCIAAGRLPEAVSAALRLLKAAGSRPFASPGWACCGAPLDKIGAAGPLEKVSARNADLLGTGRVVTVCPGCTVQLRSAYGADAWHIIEHLHSIGGIPRERFDANAPAVKVALHRPCHLARVVGPHTMEMARDLLEAVPGVLVVDHEGENDCCGGGGGVASSRPEVAEEMARRKVRSAREAGTEMIIAPCPFCVVNLRRAGGMEVEDLATFLARRLDLGQNK